MELRKKIAHGLIWSAVRTLGSQGLSCLVFFLLARLLEPGDFGLVAYANIFVSLVQALIETGMTQALTQRHSIDPLHLDSAFWFNFIVGLFMTIAGIVAAPWIGPASARTAFQGHRHPDHLGQSRRRFPGCFMCP